MDLLDETTESTTESSSEYYEDVIPLPKKEYQKGFDLQGAIKDTKSRMMPDVPQPPSDIPTDDQFWKAENLPDVEFIKKHLEAEGKFSKAQLISLFDTVYEVYCSEDNVLHIPAPITICGDIHGQFYDLLKLFELGGDPETTRYLFLGDYVDRGDFSIEVVILMFAYKCAYPQSFLMLRGNHECRHLTTHFSFKKECAVKYDHEIYESVMGVFDALPLVAIVNNQFFCVHGGISPNMMSLSDINAIDRFVEPPSNGLMCDLLWSDPTDDFTSTSPVFFTHNRNRHTSYSYGYKAVVELLNKNKWLSVIRAHEAQEHGYRMYEKNEKTGFPSLITLFSAPNYCTEYNNKAAIMRYENNSMTIKQFNDSPHPYYLPEFANVFQWSLPFVAEKLAELLLGVLKVMDTEEEQKVEELERAVMEEQQARADNIRKKVVAVSRMLALYKALRQTREERLITAPLLPPAHVASAEPESIRKISGEIKKSISPGGSPPGSSEKFKRIKTIDSGNEARPADGLQQAYLDASHASSSGDGIKRLASKERILEWKKKQTPLLVTVDEQTTEASIPDINAPPVTEHSGTGTNTPTDDATVSGEAAETKEGSS